MSEKTGEGATGWIEGARHLPTGPLPAHLANLPRDRTIVAVCRSGSRSSKVTEFLRGPMSLMSRTSTAGLASGFAEACRS